MHACSGGSINSHIITGMKLFRDLASARIVLIIVLVILLGLTLVEPGLICFTM